MTASATVAHIAPTTTFPFVALPASAGTLPVEVCLVSCLVPGSGDKLFHGVAARQRGHRQYVDELDEPSAKLHATDFAKGDATALYSFGVGRNGHPFHRHAGHRVFTAISGSGGAQLRFSTATPADIAADPASFVRALRHVNIPADCLFTVRFAGETWHQFAPLQAGATHPAFFALSCHTNESGGELSDALRRQVEADAADIPSLTELLPEPVLRLLRDPSFAARDVPTTVLALDNAPHSVLQWFCRHGRATAGVLCALLTRLLRAPRGYVVDERSPLQVHEHHDLPADSLLRTQLPGPELQHEDRFTLTVSRDALPTDAQYAPALLERLLDGFLNHPPSHVTRLMTLRNVLVRPLRLRTSSLGCPVSSLLSTQPVARFRGRFPVLDQRVDPDARGAQVILGADDRHLAFRSCAAVRVLANGDTEFSLATRVACKNRFGRFYMAAISRTHRQVVTPALLRHAVAAAIGGRV